MKKLILTLVSAISLMSSVDAQIIFQEDFDGIGGPTSGGAGTYSFPAGWFLRNVDNRTPAGAVSYVNEAWERREDFANNVADSCAFSTSWYSPAGAADDWMWTPLIGPLPANCVLKWNAVAYDPAYPDGYSVRIMTSTQGPPTGGTGVLGNQVTNSTQVFNVNAENTTWTARQVSLSAYAGQSVYIAFRNNSTDQFLLLIDDITVEVQNNIDAQMQFADTATQYTLMPATQTTPLTFAGTIRNLGINTLNNVSAHVNVFNGTTNVYSANSASTLTLAPNATTNFTIPSFTPSTTGIYTVQFIANQTTGTDQQHNNDTLYQYFAVVDSTYARDDGTVTGGLGIGAGNGGYLGQNFDVPNNDLLTSNGIFVTTGYTGRPLGLAVWSTVAGTPNAIVAVTDTIIYPDDSARYYTIPMHGGPFSITPGEYTVTAIEFNADSTIQVGTTASVFTANKQWIFWPTIPGGVWANIEDFGPQYAKPFVIRPNFGDVCLNNTAVATATQASCISCPDGSATVAVSGNQGTTTYSWSPTGGNAATATGLLTGTYVVTVTDGFGCVVMDTVNVGYDVCGLLSLSGVPVSSTCQTCADGSAQVVVTGNNGTLSYAWSNGGTSDTIQNVLPGSYTVVVTDSAGCSDSLTINIGYGVCGSFAGTTSSTLASCGSCADGSATITPVGNNGNVTYLWSNGDTTATSSNLLPGTYTVTITDTAGCVYVDSVTVNFGTAVVEISENSFAGLYPNPSTGVFQLSLNFEKATDTQVIIYNILGEVVYTKSMSGAVKGQTQINLNVPAGAYNVHVVTKDATQVLPLQIVK
ncbi:MAG: choice-of-anchor J domain-containing protein [Bacteroidia bacterium]|nr:choice-of-anchor J domain-containing protein [Bacteroidia bacterium]